MRIESTVPAIGTYFEWDISEILSRPSHDLYRYMEDFIVCSTCGAWFDDQGVFITFGDEDMCEEGDCETTSITIGQAWDLLIGDKREDEHFEDVVDAIREEGFTIPLTAYPRDGVLILCDGHHRLLAAQDLGMDTVPVIVRESFTVESDSGSWGE